MHKCLKLCEVGPEHVLHFRSETLPLQCVEPGSNHMVCAIDV